MALALLAYPGLDCAPLGRSLPEGIEFSLGVLPVADVCALLLSPTDRAVTQPGGPLGRAGGARQDARSFPIPASGDCAFWSKYKGKMQRFDTTYADAVALSADICRIAKW